MRRVVSLPMFQAMDIEELSLEASMDIDARFPASHDSNAMVIDGVLAKDGPTTMMEIDNPFDASTAMEMDRLSS